MNNLKTNNDIWMNNNIREYSILNERMKDNLNSFLILWSYFEFQFLRTNANANNIINEVEAKKSCFDDFNKYKEIFDFAHNRYTTENDVNNFFANLNFRNNDKKEFVIESLTNANITYKTISALLIIIFRIRNNLFHGLKWIYGFGNQEELFEMTNKLLKNVIEDINKT